MNYWTELTIDDALALFAPSEKSLVAKDEGIITEALMDVTARIREAAAANASNRLPVGSVIPRSYRQAALAIARRDILLRYNLEVSNSRQLAADKAEEQIRDLHDKKKRVLNDEGSLSSTASLPEIISDDPVYRTGGGLFPHA